MNSTISLLTAHRSARHIRHHARSAAVFTALALTLFLGACATSEGVSLDKNQPATSANEPQADGMAAATPAQGASATSDAPAATPNNEAAAATPAQSASAPMAAGAAPPSAMDGNTVYFDFNQFNIRREFDALIKARAGELAAAPAMRITIEGHADERGSREYNLALGQKRAEAVRKALMLLGAQDAQIETISYGEERPAAPEHNEAAWSKNRRAVIVKMHTK